MPAARAAPILLLAVMAAGLAATACGGRSPFSPATQGHGTTGGPGPASAGSPVSSGRSPAPGHGRPTGGASSHRDAGVLSGKVVGIDPGHNGGNFTHPAFLARQIWNGREWENCNTTGTQTAGGYTEALFNWNVASYLRADLRREGARVVLTRTSNHGVGPCVNTRSFIINRAHADVAVDIHADGGPAYGRGFTILEPVADGRNDGVIAGSLRFGRDVHAALLADTPMRVSDYYGRDGYISRDNLAGLNLTTVPKVLIECGNMPNPADARLLTAPRVQRQIAGALNAAIVRFLTGR
jgi:N-acetylmuramoyl-L-alanine amidase